MEPNKHPLKKQLTGITCTPQRTVQGWEAEREKASAPCQLIHSKGTEGWDLKDFEIVSYACGDKLDVNKDLSFDNFEYAYAMKASKNTNDRKKFYHFFCTAGDQETFVVAKRK